jgi:hypothetical protein
MLCSLVGDPENGCGTVLLNVGKALQDYVV